VKLKAIIFVGAMLLPGLYTVTGAFAQDDDPIQVSPEKTNAAAAVAQQTAPQPVPTKFYFEVDQNDLAAISQALSELPKRVADPLILKLNAQLQAQSQIVANKDAAEKAKKGKK
jgi:hypothetical protein